MNDVTILVNIFDGNGTYCSFVRILQKQLFLQMDYFKNINIILFENWQGINPMGLSAYLVDYIYIYTSQKLKYH